MARVRLRVGLGVGVGVKVGVGGRGDGVAFLLDEKPGIEQAVHEKQKASRPAMSQKRMRVIMSGTITEEQGGVK